MPLLRFPAPGAQGVTGTMIMRHAQGSMKASEKWWGMAELQEKPMGFLMTGAIETKGSHDD